VKSRPSRQLLKCLSVALAAGAFAAPGANAQHAPAENRTTAVPAPSVWTASSLEIDRLGPKHALLQHPYSAAPAEPSQSGPTAVGGFDWGDAGIGAGVGSVTVVLVAGLALLLTRRRGTNVPERSELAGT
jgi:hypothetical protein